MLIPLIIFILFLSAYILFVIAVLWHLKEYVLREDKYRWVTNAFLAAILVFIAISIVMFFIVPWSNLFSV